METGFVFHSLVGFFLLHGVAWALSEDRRSIAWRPVIAGMLLCLGLGLLLLKAPYAKDVFLALNGALDALEKATQDGTAFVFGFLGGGPLPFAETYAGASFVLAFRALPLVLVVSALSALLFYWRVLPWMVRGFSFLLEKTMGVGGAIGLSSAANVFVGMVEAPLVVKPYIRNMSRGELFILMSCGMATVAGTVMAISVLMVPGKASATEGRLVSQAATSSMDAVTRGTVDGAQLLVNIVAMLVVLVSLVSLANQVLALLPGVAGAPVTLQRLFGVALAPLVWIMGIPWAEATAAGALMGTKTVLNELLAYVDLAKLPEGALSPRSRLMMTYALCGFANFGSLGIMIGGLATMAPERRDEIVSLGAKTIVSGTLATCVAGSVVAIPYSDR